MLEECSMYWLGCAVRFLESQSKGREVLRVGEELVEEKKRCQPAQPITLSNSTRAVSQAYRMIKRKVETRCCVNPLIELGYRRSVESPRVKIKRP